MWATLQGGQEALIQSLLETDAWLGGGESTSEGAEEEPSSQRARIYELAASMQVWTVNDVTVTPEQLERGDVVFLSKDQRQRLVPAGLA